MYCISAAAPIAPYIIPPPPTSNMLKYTCMCSVWIKNILITFNLFRKSTPHGNLIWKIVRSALFHIFKFLMQSISFFVLLHFLKFCCTKSGSHPIFFLRPKIKDVGSFHDTPIPFPIHMVEGMVASTKCQIYLLQIPRHNLHLYAEFRIVWVNDVFIVVIWESLWCICVRSLFLCQCAVQIE